MVNRLGTAQSAYLRQHADNPISWWPWSAEAFEQARDYDRPVFISIGYAACHWCHVMAAESFEDQSVAALLNQNFVCIKVDREEHPEVDDAYMAATQALTGQGGWPMSIFTNGSGQVFHAGTYFPARRMGAVPSFTDVCEAVLEAWNQRRDQLEQQAEKIAVALGDQRRRQAQLATTVTVGEDDGGHQSLTRQNYAELAHQGLQALSEDEDTVHGGFGSAPKFPPSPLLGWLLEEPGGFALAQRTLMSMARSALCDHIEGGFARYATDDAWALPHFEKMLADNAQLIGHYAKLSVHPDADRQTQNRAAETARMTIQWLQRRMLTDQGLLASSLDADTVEPDGARTEGGTYLFSDHQLRQAAFSAGLKQHQAQRLTELNRGVAADQHAAARGEQSNVSDHTLRTIHFDAALDGDDSALWQTVLPQLRRVRAGRTQPSRDDKVVAAWNAQAVRSMAEAAALWNDAETLQFAEDLAVRLWNIHAGPDSHRQQDSASGPAGPRIARTSYAARASPMPGTLDDHAHMASACFALAAAGARSQPWLQRGQAVLEYVLSEFVTEHDGAPQLRQSLDTQGLLAHAQDGAAGASVVDGPEPSSIGAVLHPLQTSQALGLGSQQQLRPQQLLHHLPVLAPKAPSAVGSSLLAARRAVLGSPALRVFSADPRDEAQIRSAAALHGIPVEPIDAAALQPGARLEVSVCLNSPEHAVCLAPSSSVDQALAELT